MVNPNKSHTKHFKPRLYQFFWHLINDFLNFIIYSTQNHKPQKMISDLRFFEPKGTYKYWSTFLSPKTFYHHQILHKTDEKDDCSVYSSAKNDFIVPEKGGFYSCNLKLVVDK